MHDLVILGSGRSGTSMLAGLFAHAGWFVGDDPYPGREANPKGFFEARDVNGINEWLIASVEPRSTDLGAWQRWLSVLPDGVEFRVPAELAERMRRLCARRPFCFKDPRFSYTLPAWRDALGAAKHLVVFREPAATAASIVKECRTADYLKGLDFSFERALESWSASYRRLLDASRRGGDWLFLHYDQILSGDALDALEACADAPIARDFPERSLKRSRAESAVPSEVAELYRELCARAGVVHPAQPTRNEPRATFDVGVTFAAPELSVILCTYNRRDVLAESLAAWEAQAVLPGAFELVIVDDGSNDGTSKLLAEREFRVPTERIRRPNGGLAAARNTGIAAARGKRLLLVNDDTIAFPNLVEEHLVAVAERGDPSLSVLGTFEQPASALDNVLMRHLEDSNEVFCYADMQPGSVYGWNRFWTCNLSVSAELVRRAGGFDESFRRYGCEDTDLGVRLEAFGARVLYHAEARALHRHVLDFDALAKRNRTVAQAWVAFFAKHPRLLNDPDWTWVRGLSAADCERAVDQRRPELVALERAARELARVDVGAFDRRFPALADASANTLKSLAELLKELNAIWWRQGFAAGLAEQGAEAFADFLPPEPWPLATDAPVRAIAWPNWSAADLDALFDEFGDVFAGREENCLVLRHDARIDPPQLEAQAELAQAYARRFPGGDAINVLVLDDRLGARDTARVGRAVRAAIVLPSAAERVRRSWLLALHAELVADEVGLERIVPRPYGAEKRLALRAPAAD
ncbi:MAG: glycosyltransferase [Planctomycetes bacterium]|nr:glycosyltransferase [Planctomycetota bacterium]